MAVRPGFLPSPVTGTFPGSDSPEAGAAEADREFFHHANFLSLTEAVCYPKSMVCRLGLALLLFASLAGGIRSGQAGVYPLTDGTTLEGEPISINAQGVVVKKADGTFAPRVAWTNFTQVALKEFAEQPKAKPFIEPYLEIDETEVTRKPVLEIKPKVFKRLERPNPEAGLGAVFSSPLTVVMFVILWVANIYAGFEIALFRNYQPGLVCALAAALPVVGPVLFLCLPTRVQRSHAELAAETMAQHMAETPHVFHAGQEGPAAAEAAAPEKAALAKPKVTVYQRGQTTFNRRFFETKFAGFLRMVPGEAEKDMLICIKSARGEHVGNRLTRIMPNELYLQVHKGEATADVIIPFTEIYEVQVRPKSP